MPRSRPARAAKRLKTDTAATETDIHDAIQSGDEFEQVFAVYPAISDDATDVTDTSDYAGRKRKLPAKKRGRKRMKAASRKLAMIRKAKADVPDADPVSDGEYDSSPESGYGHNRLKSHERTPAKSGDEKQHNKAASIFSTEVSTGGQSTPNILQIHVNTGLEKGGSTINVDLTPLLKQRNTGTALPISANNDETFVEDGSSTVLVNPSVIPSLRMQRLNDAKFRMSAAKETKKHAGFTDLPAEVRLRIYRNAFVTEEPISFHSRHNFQRSSVFLRTCKIAHEEGRAVLYGENSFHFERSHSTRGKFFEEDWREIGFKDMRRFLETIGNVNISMMRSISIEFGDATKSYSPTEEVERRFVNDPVVWRCLELIGSNAHLDRFAMTFAGRRNLDRTDLHFLRALAGIKSQQVVNVANLGGGYKVKPGIVTDLKKLMVVRRDDPEEVDVNRKKSLALMHHEYDDGSTIFPLQCR